jgi:DNA modification methylase
VATVELRMSLPEPYYADDFCTIYHGDSRELLPLLDAGVMVTDPPYGYAYASNKINANGRGDAPWRGQQIANDDDVSARDDVLDTWGDRPALVFGSWKRPKPKGTRALLIWDKGGAAGMGDLALPWKPNHEEIYVLGGDGFAGDRGSGVLSYDNVTSIAAGREHPNEKPARLMRHLVGKCRPGLTIIDPFMGSGSTLRAAKDLGRKCIGIEIDEKWCKVAVRRLAQDNLFADGAA